MSMHSMTVMSETVIYVGSSKMTKIVEYGDGS